MKNWQEKVKLRYSSQAKVILDKLEEGTIDLGDFEEWAQKNAFIVGGGHIVTYLEYKEKDAKQKPSQ